jgi:hypothetical protein
MQFEWDLRKEASNRRKHGVGFREAATVFGDPLATTFPDPDHSAFEERFLTIGESASGRALVVAHPESGENIRIIMRGRSRAARGDSMKKTLRQRNHDGMRSEYDFASMKGGVRGKHYREYRNGTNVVLLQPDVAEAFPTEDAVNEALRGILTTARAVRRTGRRPDRAVGATPSASKPYRRK